MAVNLGTIYAEIGLRIDKLVRGAAEAKAKLSELEKRMESTEKASKALGLGVAAMGTAMVAAGSYAIVLAAQMEQSEIAFGTLLGSGEKAKTFLAGLSDFAARTPFELKGLMRGSRMLLAFGFQAQDIIPMMTAVGDSVAALGGGEFEIQRVVRALGQMRAKGRASAQEMMQMAELGIPAWELLAQQMGVGIPEAMKMAEQGAIDSTTAIDAILSGMQGRFAGAMDAQSRSIIGMWSTVRDNVALAATHMGKALIEGLDISAHMARAVEALDELRITMEAFSKVVTERGLRAAMIELFGPAPVIAVMALAGAVTAALIPAIYAAAKALWIKFAALAAIKPFLLISAAASGLFAARMVAQTEAARGSTKSLQEHIDELRTQAKSTRDSTTQTARFGQTLGQTGNAATRAGEQIANAAADAEASIRRATSNVDRLHDALFRALRRKYEADRNAAMQAVDAQFAARRKLIEEQLGLLDETARQEDFHTEQSERGLELSMLQRELGYETDARRRAAIQSRIADVEKTIAEAQLRFDRDSRRKGLQDQLESLRQEEANAKTSAESMWAKRLEDARLAGEAEKLIIAGNQQAILVLLEQYGDGWRDIGATFGQRLIEGMGSYPEELRKMIVGALDAARAAADGTIARLREVATAAAAVGQQPAAPAARPDPTAVTIARAPITRPPAPPTVPVTGTAAERARLIQEQLAQRPELLQHRIGPTPPTAGVVVNIQSMQVRRQDDIDGISRQLHRRIQSSTRAKGGRY